LLWVVGVVTAVLTAVYMTRMMVMTFWGSERFHDELPDEHADHGDDDEDHHAIPADFHPHESPWSMTVPLVVLAVLATVGGLVGIPYAVSSMVGAGDINVFEHTLEPVIAKVGTDSHGGAATEHGAESVTPAAAEHAAHDPEEIQNERLLAGLSLLLAVCGVVGGFVYFKKNPLKTMPRVLQKKWYLDEIYNKGIVDPITNLSRKGLWQGFDVGFVDGTVNGIGSLVSELGSVARRIQVGFVRSYAAIILLGALVVVGYFIYYGFKLIS
ncbi:MAG: hypothetical protein KDB79_16255, partial [Acidobacteria bacterium]|nr:hypothetical protein [Acidobacteriota bacterium]